MYERTTTTTQKQLETAYGVYPQCTIVHHSDIFEQQRNLQKKKNVRNIHKNHFTPFALRYYSAIAFHIQTIHKTLESIEIDFTFSQTPQCC